MSHKGKTPRGSDIILENSGKISGLRSLYFSNNFGNNYWNEDGGGGGACKARLHTIIIYYIYYIYNVRRRKLEKSQLENIHPFT